MTTMFFTTTTTTSSSRHQPSSSSSSSSSSAQQGQRPSRQQQQHYHHHRDAAGGGSIRRFLVFCHHHDDHDNGYNCYDHHGYNHHQHVVQQKEEEEEGNNCCCRVRYHHHHHRKHHHVLRPLVIVILLQLLATKKSSHGGADAGFMTISSNHHQKYSPGGRRGGVGQILRQQQQQQQQKDNNMEGDVSNHYHANNVALDPSSSSSSSNRVDPSMSSSRRRAMERLGAIAATTTTASGLWIPPGSGRSQHHAANAAASTATTVTEDTFSTTKPGVVPTIRLGKSTLEVSRTIQGYWQLAGGHGRYRESDAIDNMNAHYKAGITTLDSADIYGPSEIIIGKFMQQQPTAIPNTKLCCFRFLEDIDRTEILDRIQRQCERLSVSKLPLVQYFWANYDIKRYIDVALYLTELKDKGYIQEIGATNFDLKRLQELVNADVPIVSHQVQLSALDRRPIQSGMADWCAANDISLIGFGTVCSGILSDRYLGRNTPPTQEERNTASMRMYSTTAERFGNWKLVQELLYTMNEIAMTVRNDGRCYDCNISNIAQRYVLQTPSVASVLIGVRNQDHIAENVRTHSFQLKQDEIDMINTIVAKRNGPKGDVWDIERGTLRG